MCPTESRNAPRRPLRRVLVVDDHDDCRTSLADLLRLNDFEPIPCRSGDEAIAIAAAIDPEVILLDLAMPGRDGYSTARAIRAGQRSRRMFIAALSGMARETDRELSLAAGIDTHLAKPYDPRRLIDLLRSVA